jgi:hypothetical protein
MSHCPGNIPKKYPNLILKHKILSPECDQFRVLSVNSRCFSFSFLALCVGIGIAIYALQVAVSGFTAAACVVLLLAVLVAYLLQPIEGTLYFYRFILNFHQCRTRSYCPFSWNPIDGSKWFPPGILDFLSIRIGGFFLHF